MNNPNHEHAKLLFLAAAELPSREERAAYLYRECGSDTQLRARVEALLAADEAAATLAEYRADETMASADPNQTMASVVLPGTAPSIVLPPQSYVVGREIAHGGMGSVLHAQDCKLGRDVAMKVMRLSAAASEEARSRFIREATVLARLEHPNIVPIHELGWDAENRLYYTMKLVQGRTLQAVLNGLRNRDADFIGHYTLDRLLTIFRKVCDAMSLAHAKGVIHRDLKPDNIMVGEFGEVLVMDWGLAKIQADAKQAAEEAALKADVGSAERFRELADSELSRSAGLTLDGAVMGTPLYMSPEQAGGRLAEIDQQSDIFSLGGILYALLTLHPPVDGKTADEIMSRIKGGQILPPTVFNVSTKSGAAGKSPEAKAADPKKFQPLPHCPHGKVPSALSAVTMRALSVNKSKRYKTVAEFAADIEAYQGGFATSAEQAGLLTQLRLLIQRHKREFGVAFAAWLVITALAVWFVINLRASERETRRQAQIALANERKAVASELEAKAEATRAATAEQIAKDQAMRAMNSEAAAVREKESARRSLARSALSLAEAARREGNGPDMQAALNDVPEDLRDSTWNYLLEQSDTSIARIRGSRADAFIAGAAADPRHPGVFATFDNQGQLAFVDVRTGARVSEFVTPVKANSSSVSVFAVSPDGQRIAASSKSSIIIVSALDGKTVARWEGGDARRLEFSPDGKLLIQENGSSTFANVWDAAAGKLLWDYTPPQPQSGHAYATFTPDGSQVLTYSSKDDFRLVNAADGKMMRGFKRGQYSAVSAPVLGSKGLLAFADVGGFVAVADLKVGRIVVEFRAHSEAVKNIAFTPDGEQLVTAGDLPDGRQAISLWQARTGDRVRSLLGGSGLIKGLSVHPLTGELVVFGPNTRAWSLTGTPPTWELPRNGHCSPPVFWGSDDVILADGFGVHSALQKLQAGGSSLLWKPSNFSAVEAGVSADGKVAVEWNNPPGPDADSRRAMLVLRNPGAAPEIIGAIKTHYYSHIGRLTPNGDRVVNTGWSHDGVEILDTSTGQQAFKLERVDIKRFWDFAWLAGGKQLLGLVTAKADRGLGGSEERIVVWDATTGKIIKSVPSRAVLGVLAIAADGKRFAEAGADKMVRIRDCETLEVLREFRAHDGPITAMRWHPHKPILATASADLSIKLWNLETGRRLEELRVPFHIPDALAFSPSGQRLASSGYDDNTRIWEPRSLNDHPATSQPADAWEDLLASFTPEKVEETGNGWHMEDGALFSPDKRGAFVPLPGSFAGCSYQVRIRLRQIAVKEAFYLHLPVASRMVNFEMDEFPHDGYYSGLKDVSGKHGKDLPGTVHGKVVKDAEQHDLEATVRLFGPSAIISFTFDGQPLYEWSGPAAALTDSYAGTPGVISVGTYAGGWVVYDVKAKRQQ